MHKLRSGLVGALCAASVSGQPVSAGNAVADLLSEIIRVNTSNPPGSTGPLDELLAAKLKPLGFEITIVPTPEAGKSALFARLRGDGSAKPVLVASHGDVVGVEREKWSLDPFAGIVKDGYVYGRGAIDFKGGIAVFTEAVMRLARNKVPLKRDVILLVEADEEGAQYNTSWLADSHWDQMDCEFALNEGGWIMKRPDGKVRYVSISTADKSGISLVVTAHGTSTHSSMPRPDQAIFRLAKALAKLADYDTKPELTASTREFFLTLAKTSEPPMSTYFYNLVNSKDPALVAQADKEISKDTLLHAIMRNTIAPVLMQAGFRGNVIPGSAECTINFRTIPGTTPEDLIAEMKKVIGDPNVDVAVPPANPAMARLSRSVRNVKPSPTDSPLYQALVKSANQVWPGVPVTQYLFQAGTDAFAWRSRGVPVYGVYPYPISNEDLSRMHGNDERVPVDSLEQGTDYIYQTLLEVAAK
ncbi:MAG TPA: M20/M25/M40 family metallo-hydrolase [Bryobacteraceae bacterium]|nr:M20/M25/M40 family metallo-hydrolase [Bryobacteraceae bacterium]